ncbi:MAG: DUF4191 domain-containing protein [Actinomycetes bacterium]
MARKEGRRGRAAQIRAAYQMTKKADPRIGLLLFAIALAVLAVFVGVGFLVGYPIYAGVLGLPMALLAVTIVFGRRAERAAFGQVEGQPGAAGAVLNSLRRGWTVTSPVAVTKNQDIVHRAVGRPGIVLVGEGAPNRVTNLLAAERRRHARVAPDAPVYEVVAGDEEGQVKLRKLQRHLMKLPRNLKPADVREVNNRLRALGQTSIPIPKGPLPKGMRMPKGGPNIR